MKTAILLTLMMMTLNSFANWESKFVCKKVAGIELVATASGTIYMKTLNGPDESYEARVELDKMSLFSAFGKKAGSVMNDLDLTSLEASQVGDYTKASLSPDVGHSVIKIINLQLGSGLKTQMISNKGNMYSMICSYVD